ncbi:MAG: hypothetical protein WDM94_09185 [Bauldia sp.]
MSTPSIYTDGTISVEAGSAAFTGSGTAWSTQLKRGTEINIGGLTATVAEIAGDAAGTFVAPWPGETAADADYVAKTWTDGAEIAEAIRLLIERLIGKGLGVVAPGNPVAADYRDNDLVYSRKTGLLAIKDLGVMKALTAPGNYGAYGLAADRDDHDEDDQYFTYFATDETGFYVLLTPADDPDPAVWSDLVSIAGASAEDVLAELGVHNITISEADPSGGVNNDLWFKV